MSYTSLLNIGNNISNNESSLYNRLAPIWVYTSSTTFTVPFTGKYRVVCIGKGGDGGSGKSQTYSNSSSYYVTAGTGGGSGGCGIGLFELSEDQSINISVNNESSNFDNGKIISTAGGNGNTGGVSRGDAVGLIEGGIGGSVSGTDVLISISGISANSLNGLFSHKQNGSIGASISCAFFNSVVYGNKFGMMINEPTNGTVTYAYGATTKLDYESIDNTYRCNFPYGGLAGCGGDGAGSIATYYSNSNYNSYTQNGTGGKGGPGCILIEFLGE